MTTVESNSASPQPEKTEEEVTKSTFRKQVWLHLEKNKLVNFPRPVFGRIPNFKGSDEAAAKLLELDEFKNAKYVEVNPDKAQEFARMIVLEQQKQLYVPVPRLKDGLLKHITVPEGASKEEVKNAVSRGGIELHGSTVSINDSIEIDLIIMGSVVVCQEGYRIGKGRGYVDLEFAVLKEMKAITDKTVIVTIVHDNQVFESLPKQIFKDFDVPVDIILTPTQILRTSGRLSRPDGIIWNILSNRRVSLMPALQALKDANEKSGVEVTLKDEDTDVETYERKRFNKRFQRRRPRSEGRTSESQGEEGKDENVRPKQPLRRRRFYRRPPMPRKTDKVEKENESGNENKQQRGQQLRKNGRLRRPFRKNKSQIDFSLMVSNIEKNVRVRDLKNALNERGIKPNEITWRGYKGFCYLHYAKPRETNANENSKDLNPVKPIVVDNVIEILQNLKICPESENGLNVKIVEPISRIETTNVTAV